MQSSERTRIKICGIREAEHARLAAEAGADAIGLVFYGASPRHIRPADAAKVVGALPPYISVVGLFVNADADAVYAVLDELHLDLLQFQGDETPEFCEGFGLPYVRAVRMEKGVDLVEYRRRFPGARALMVDAHVPGQRGGTGQVFDWAELPSKHPAPLILSGGLTAENVGFAIRQVRPWAVDVSSGVESSRGVKDPAKIVEFIRSVRSEDAGTPV
jgi:phosphoribosylanthranilate isomerase